MSAGTLTQLVESVLASPQRRLSPRDCVHAELAPVCGADLAGIEKLDLKTIFLRYDQLAFGGLVAPLLSSRGQPLTVTWSTRLSRSGASTHVVRRRGVVLRYEIRLGLRILRMNFLAPGAAPTVSGHPCRDRLDAMLALFEHEMIHLVEYMVFGRSSCRGKRFMALAGRLFGHIQRTHGLDIPLTLLQKTHGLGVGDQVRFAFRGRELVGKINRIRVRASILVPDPAGRRYTDGGRYLSFLVPLARLRPAAGASAPEPRALANPG